MSSPPSSFPLVAVPPDLVKTSGPLIIGYLLAWGLYGVLAVQSYIYYLAFPNDRAINKWLVGIVFLLETAQAIVIARDTFESFAKGFGHPDAITATHMTGFSAPIIAGSVGFIVQVFYAFRIRVLSNSTIVPVIICFLAFVQCVGAFISGVRGFIAEDVRHLDTMTDRVGHGLFNATSAACDIVIAVAMSYYLPKLNSGVRDSTQAAVRRIVRLVVGTGSLTAAVAIIDQALFEAFPGTGYFLAPAFMTGKLYSNSMMVIFNSRVALGVLQGEATISLTPSDARPVHFGTGGYIVRNAYRLDSTYEESTVTRGIDLDIGPGKNDSSELGHGQA